MTPPTQAKLRRDILGLGAGLLVLNGMIGAGIFKLPARVEDLASGWAVWMFPAVGLLFLAIVLCFAELASRFRGSGGPVEYADEAFGPFAGFQAGWLLFLSRMTALAANTGVLMDYLGREFEPLATGLGRGLGICLVIGGLTLINVRGLRGAMRTLVSLSLLKVLPLFALMLWGLVQLRPELLSPQAPRPDAELRNATLAVVYAFVGFETVTATAGETRHADRTIPRALLWTLGGTILLYTGVQLAYSNVAPQLQGSSPAPLLPAAEVYFGPAGHYLLFAAALTSLLGNLHTSVVSAPRLIFALAERRQLPRMLARVHPRFATPDRCILLYGAGGLALGLLGSFGELSAASSLSRTLVYALCAIALLRLRQRRGPAPFHLRGGPTLPILACLICAWLASLPGLEIWRTLAILLGAGFLLQLLGRQRQQKG